MRTPKILRPVIPVLILLILAACSVSAPVHSIANIEGEVVTFKGVAVGYMDRTGTIEMKSMDGQITCVGEFRYANSQTGHGRLRCSNGEVANIQFIALGTVSGYGYGTSTSGYALAFTYGLDGRQKERYLRLENAGASTEKRTNSTAKKKSTQASAETKSVRLEDEKEPSRPSADTNRVRPEKEKKPSQPNEAIGGTGSGFSIGSELLITNAHVVSGCESVILKHSQFGAIQGGVLARDTVNDLAAIRVQLWPGKSVYWNAERDIRVGSRIATYGFPFGGAIASSGSLTTGDVNALTGLNNDSRFLQISAPVQVSDVSAYGTN